MAHHEKVYCVVPENIHTPAIEVIFTSITPSGGHKTPLCTRWNFPDFSTRLPSPMESPFFTEMLHILHIYYINGLGKLTKLSDKDNSLLLTTPVMSPLH